MITQRLIMTGGMWACAGCRVRFSVNEDGGVFLVHHGNCPEMAAISCERMLRRITEAMKAERERIRQVAVAHEAVAWSGNDYEPDLTFTDLIDGHCSLDCRRCGGKSAMIEPPFNDDHHHTARRRRHHMGWASAGYIFDPVAKAMIELKAPDEMKIRVLGDLIGVLRDGDWDTECESLDEFQDDPAIVEAFRQHGVIIRCAHEGDDGWCDLERDHEGDHDYDY